MLENLINNNGNLNSNKTRVNYLKKHNLYEYIISNSKELNTDSLSERIYFIYNNLTIEDTVCKNPSCNNKSIYTNFKKGYKSTCSIKCGSIYRSLITIEKRKNVFLNKLSTRYPNKKFNLDNWTNTSSNIEMICEEGHKTITNYDNVNYKAICSECEGIKKAIKFKELANEKHGKIYKYNFNTLNNFSDEITITCEKHGDFKIKGNYHLDGTACRKCSGKSIYNTVHLQEYIDENNLQIILMSEYKESKQEIFCKCKLCGNVFVTSPMYIKQSLPGCSICSRNILTEEKFKETLDEKFPNIDYSESKFISQSIKTTFRCKIHNQYFNQIPRALLNGYKGCTSCQSQGFSKSEKEILNFVLKHTNAVPNTKKVIYPYELDIYVPAENFAIEYNGLMFHSEGSYSKGKIGNINKNYHLQKTELCEEKGIQLFHVFENEWIDPIKQEIWKSVIMSKLGFTERIFARKTEIRIVQNKEKDLFLEQNHLQGTCNSKINIGLYFNNSLVSIMTFSKSRFSKKYEYELLRFASKLNTTVVGGGSKLIKFFEEQYKPKSLISYANRRWSTGNFYKAVGFKFSHNSGPNYFYFKSGSLVLESRNKYQKHKLHKVLENFNPKLSEQDNMFNNDYRRIYDSGNKIYIKEY